MSKLFNIATTVTFSYYPFLLSFLGSYFYQHRGGLAGKLFIGIDQFPEFALRKLSQYEGVELIPVIQNSRQFNGVHGDAWTHAVAKKLDMAKQIIAQTQKPLLLIDNDILFIKPIDELFKIDHDIVVTHIESERERHVRKDGLPINFIASAVFFNTPEKSISFINEWQAVMSMLTEKTVPPYETPALNVLLNQITSGSKNLGLSVGVIKDSVIASDQASKKNTRAIHLKSWGPSKLGAVDNYWARCSRRSFDRTEFAPAHTDYLAMEDWLCTTLYAEITPRSNTNSRTDSGAIPNPQFLKHDDVKLKKKKRFIFADGGLANRLLCILYPLAMGGYDKYDLELLWPRTNWCDCDFTTLFESEIISSSLHINDPSSVKNFNKNTLIISHIKTALAQDFEELSQGEISNEEHFLNIWSDSHRPVLYNHHSLPHFFSGDPQSIPKLMPAFQVFRPQSYIIRNVQRFLSAHDISPESTVGLHVRGTDFNPSEDLISRAEDFIKANPNQKIFLCTDDEFIKSRLAISSNVIVQKNIALVNFDEERAEIYRSSDSVISALTDLLILSNTRILRTSNSSYLYLARLISVLRSSLSDLSWR